MFNLTFAEADQRLNESAGKHSGCTAIAALVRTDICDEGDENGGTETVARNGTDSAKKTYKVRVNKDHVIMMTRTNFISNGYCQYHHSTLPLSPFALIVLITSLFHLARFVYC